MSTCTSFGVGLKTRTSSAPSDPPHRRHFGARRRGGGHRPSSSYRGLDRPRPASGGTRRRRARTGRPRRGRSHTTSEWTPQHLRAFHLDDRAGGQRRRIVIGPREKKPVARSSVSARAHARRRRCDVDELVLDDALVSDRETAGEDEPARREGGQADLGRPTLGRRAHVSPPRTRIRPSTSWSARAEGTRPADDGRGTGCRARP